MRTSWSNILDFCRKQTVFLKMQIDHSNQTRNFVIIWSQHISTNQQWGTQESLVEVGRFEPRQCFLKPDQFRGWTNSLLTLVSKSARERSNSYNHGRLLRNDGQQWWSRIRINKQESWSVYGWRSEMIGWIMKFILINDGSCWRIIVWWRLIMINTQLMTVRENQWWLSYVFFWTRE